MTETITIKDIFKSGETEHGLTIFDKDMIDQIKIFINYADYDIFNEISNIMDNIYPNLYDKDNIKINLNDLYNHYMKKDMYFNYTKIKLNKCQSKYIKLLFLKSLKCECDIQRVK